MSELSNIATKKIKLTTFQGEKYNEIDLTNLRNSVFLSEPSLLNSKINDASFTIQFYKDSNFKDEITTHVVKDLGKWEVFVKLDIKKMGVTTLNKFLQIEIYSMDPLLDSNDDGISDFLSMTGYTIENGRIRRWYEKKDNNNKKFIKYVSDPYKKSTTGDPYSDIDKVLGKIDQTILPEARHPLVAAYPSISLIMEKIILSKNINIKSSLGENESQETGQTISRAMSNSSLTSQTNEWKGGISLKEGFETSYGYSHQNTTTITRADTQADTQASTLGKSWTDSLSMNSSDIALLAGNIRYVNFATAPSYSALPTLNFVLNKATNFETIATINANKNTSVNCLLPNKTYPSSHQHPVTWNTSDDANSQPIKLSFEQVQAIDEGNNLLIQTTQASGYYKKYDFSEEVKINESQKWEYILADIYNRTACITIAFKDGSIQQRRVSARSEINYEKQTQPEITVGEAIKIAFSNSEVGRDNINYQGIEISKNNVIFDKELVAENEKDKESRNLFSIKLKQNMNITILENELKTIIDNKKNENTEIDNKLQLIIKQAIDKNPIKISIGELSNLGNFRSKITGILAANNYNLISNSLPLRSQIHFDKNKIAIYSGNIYQNDNTKQNDNNVPPQIREDSFSELKNIVFNWKVYWYIIYKNSPNANENGGIYIPINIRVISNAEIQAEIEKNAKEKPIELLVGEINETQELESFISKTQNYLKKSNCELISNLLPSEYRYTFDEKKITIEDKIFRIHNDNSGFKQIDDNQELDNNLEEELYFHVSYADTPIDNFTSGIYIPLVKKTVKNDKIQKLIKESADKSPIEIKFSDINGSDDNTKKYLESRIYSEIPNFLSPNHQILFEKRKLHIPNFNIYKNTSYKREQFFSKSDLSKLAKIVSSVTAYFYIVYNLKMDESGDVTDLTAGAFIPIIIKFN